MDKYKVVIVLSDHILLVPKNEEEEGTHLQKTALVYWHHNRIFSEWEATLGRLGYAPVEVEFYSRI